MEASLNSLLLLSAFLLLSFPRFILSARHCSDCGFTPVPYPLSTAPNCGDQLYKVRCDAGMLWFDPSSNSYPITSISPEIQRLTIQPVPFLPNSCITTDLSTRGVQLNPDLPFNITSSNTIFFLNCSENLFRSPLNCSSTSLCHTFVNGTTNANDGAACGGSLICCSLKVGGSTTSYSIHISNEGCLAYRSFVNLNYSLPVSRWPLPGMELQWISPREPICGPQSDCDSVSTCGPDPSSDNGTRRCFCNLRFHWDAIAGLCAKSKYNSIIFFFLEKKKKKISFFLFRCCLHVNVRFCGADSKCEDPDGCGSRRAGLIAGKVFAIIIFFYFY